MNLPVGVPLVPFECTWTYVKHEATGQAQQSDRLAKKTATAITAVSVKLMIVNINIHITIRCINNNYIWECCSVGESFSSRLVLTDCPVL